MTKECIFPGIYIFACEDKTMGVEEQDEETKMKPTRVGNAFARDLDHLSPGTLLGNSSLQVHCQYNISNGLSNDHAPAYDH